MIYSEVSFLPISGWHGLHSVFPHSPYRLTRMRRAGGSGEKFFSGSISQMRHKHLSEKRAHHAGENCWAHFCSLLLTHYLRWKGMLALVTFAERSTIRSRPPSGMS